MKKTIQILTVLIISSIVGYSQSYHRNGNYFSDVYAEYEPELNEKDTRIVYYSYNNKPASFKIEFPDGSGSGSVAFFYLDENLKIKTTHLIINTE